MKNFKKYSSIILLIFLVLIKIQDSNFVRKIENISYDAYQSLFIEKSNFDEVVIIDIDEKSIGEIGQFPWRRDKVAKIVDNLTAANPKVIAFDIFFSEPDRENPTKILKELSISTDSVIDSDLEFTKSIGQSLLNAYLPIVQKRKDESFDDRHKQFQLFRRSRYVEFNLLQDRGTLFGIQSGGRAESILMSMPPTVKWRYDWSPEKDSAEEDLYTKFLINKKWV